MSFNKCDNCSNNNKNAYFCLEREINSIGECLNFKPPYHHQLLFNTHNYVGTYLCVLNISCIETHMVKVIANNEDEAIKKFGEYIKK